MKIVDYHKLSDFQKESVKEIFWKTSSVNVFGSISEKDDFFYKYLGYYIQSLNCFCYVSLIENYVQGYCCGHSNTFSDIELMKLQPHLGQFANIGKPFPGHLHINIDPQEHGKGLGSLLINFVCKEMKMISGLHIITGAQSRNKKFYKLNGFDYEYYSECGSLCFMGKYL